LIRGHIPALFRPLPASAYRPASTSLRSFACPSSRTRRLPNPEPGFSRSATVALPVAHFEPSSAATDLYHWCVPSFLRIKLNPRWGRQESISLIPGHIPASFRPPPLAAASRAAPTSSRSQVKTHLADCPASRTNMRNRRPPRSAVRTISAAQIIVSTLK
jgi:hypothetical protein